MSSNPDKSPFSPAHLAKFRETQALRPVALRRFSDGMEVWRSCKRKTSPHYKTCRHNKSCQRSDHAGLSAFMQALDDSERRLILYAFEFRCDGLSPDEAIEMAQARVRGEMRGMAQSEAEESAGGAFGA